MEGMRHRQVDLVIAAASVIGLAGVIWLAPLMMDQLVFIADQEQNRQAAVAREAMIPAGGLLLVASAAYLVRGRPWHALFAALPALVAVPLALLAPGDAYQLIAYVITAPLSFAALLSAVVPRPRLVSRPMQISAALALLVALVLATPFLAMMVLLAAVAWWRLPPTPDTSEEHANRR